MNTRFTLRKKMLVLTVLPIFVLGILVIFLSLTVVKNAMVSEIEDALRRLQTAISGKEVTTFPNPRVL